jgi:hypothetical protein
MTIEQLRRVARAEPFDPFTIHLADGRAFHVPHPEFITIPPTAVRTFVVAGPEEEYRIIDRRLITLLDFENGPTKRRRNRR